jgi:hypothetical protein
VNYYNEHDPKKAAWLRELVAGALRAAEIAAVLVRSRAAAPGPASEEECPTACAR